jgi:hypothetical protein
MYNLLAKYGYRSFMEGEGAAGGAGGANPGDGAGAPLSEQGAPGANTTSEGVNTGDPGQKPAGSETQPADNASGKTALAAAAAKAKGDTAPAAEWKEYVDDPAKTADENKALKEAHDKTKPAAETAEQKAAREKAEADAKKAGEKTPEEKAAEAKAHGESIKLDPPAGFELDKEVEADFRAVVGENKWDQATVDKLKGIQIKLYEKQADAHAATVTKWGEDLKADKELGGPMHDAKVGQAGAVLNEFFSPEIAGLMDKTGLGNHPEFVRGFYKIALAVGELPTFKDRAGFGGKEDIIDVLYPKS